ncbi:hypothetical protein JNMOADIG_00151 [Aeromonas phage avDM5]|uniref:Uncharacterized protein n=1 Tax=Aeromonas phage vB_AehM_DM2 TaxID=2973716 RepID=A0AA95C7E5_9CAUD|nr:hypothetical protein JNMOADIG_00151 [Aeromonas phage avDM5]UYD60354.1 hypothetical protein NPHMPGLK_00011 [Aeromonas phage avDM2]UYD60810.1 hypothetical protein NHNEHLNL_00222 [Aeromonas phage avDM2]
MKIVNITTTRPDVCCGQDKFIGLHEYCFGPCGAGDGWIGKCVVCQKEWEIDSDSIAEVKRGWKQHDCGEIPLPFGITVADLIYILSKFNAHTPIGFIHLTGSENAVRAYSDEDGLTILE